MCRKPRGGQDFVAEGGEIEGPPPLDVFGSFPKYNRHMQFFSSNF